MNVWEVDFYRRPLQDASGRPLWELVIVDSTQFKKVVMCPQPEASSDWLEKQIRQILDDGHPQPDVIHIFRPQTFNLLEPVCEALNIKIVATRRTPKLKHSLQELAQTYPASPAYTRQPYRPLEVEKPPPLPLEEDLWGEQWRFATITAGELIDSFSGRMIPILEMPEFLFPLNLGLPSTTPIPGVVIDGGRRSRRLATWIQATQPVALNYIAGSPDGLMLEAGLVDRWIVATFEDPDMAESATSFETRKQASKGLHFLLVQPDNSGVTYSGCWLLQTVE